MCLGAGNTVDTEEGVSDLLICYPRRVSERNRTTCVIASHDDNASAPLPLLPRHSVAHLGLDRLRRRGAGEASRVIRGEGRGKSARSYARSFTSSCTGRDSAKVCKGLRSASGYAILLTTSPTRRGRPTASAYSTGARTRKRAGMRSLLREAFGERLTRSTDN
jgi:hypothetical protein